MPLSLNHEAVLLRKLNATCSPYEVVTGKIYHLKQYLLLPATTWKFTKIKLVVLKNMQVVIRSDSHKEMNEYCYIIFSDDWNDAPCLSHFCSLAMM